jgi:Rieske Fe-S protein
MAQPVDVSRRTLIFIGGIGTSLALAGCSPAAPSGSGAGAGAEDPGAAGSEGAAGTPVEVAKVADVPVGGSISATLSGAPILLSQPTAGDILAFTAICTHQGCVVEPAKTEFDCPCHGSRYDAATGEVLGGPAPRALERIPVTVTGDAIMAG